MIPTYITILFLMLLFSKKFRESLKSLLKGLPKFFDSIIIKNKNTYFKLCLVLIATVLIIDSVGVIVLLIFEVPEAITWNFLSDLLSAAIWLFLLKRVVTILFNQNLNDYFKTDFGILKGFSLAILSIGLVLGFSYVTYPLASQLPTFEIFNEIRQEIFQKPKTGFEFILLAFSLSIIPAFLEEIFFRGILYKIFRQKYGITISVIISTLISYLFHIDPRMIFFLVMGNVVLCLSFESTKSLVVPFVIHLGINFSSLLFYLYNQKVTLLL